MNLDRRFRITIVDEKPIGLPAEGFSPRQSSACWFHGCCYLLCDIVPWDNPYHPDTYDSSIGFYRTKDLLLWEYLGEVVPKGQPGEWNSGGVGTPSVCVFNDRVYVAYSGRTQAGGGGHRFIGVKEANHPEGPFRPVPELMVRLDDIDYTVDDPCLITSNAEGTGPGNDRLHLIYRQRLIDHRQRTDPGNPGENQSVRLREQTVRMRHMTRSRRLWSKPYPIVTAPLDRAVETV